MNALVLRKPGHFSTLGGGGGRRRDGWKAKNYVPPLFFEKAGTKTPLEAVSTSSVSIF